MTLQRLGLSAPTRGKGAALAAASLFALTPLAGTALAQEVKIAVIGGIVFGLAGCAVQGVMIAGLVISYTQR